VIVGAYLRATHPLVGELCQTGDKQKEVACKTLARPALTL